MKYSFKTLRILYIGFVILFISQNLTGQDDKEYVYSGRTNLIILPGLSYQGSGNFYGELSVMLSKPISGVLSHYDQGFIFGLESNLSKDNYVFAPKIGYETALLFQFRGSIISYIDNKNVDLRTLLEMGTGSFKYFTILYGYNVPLLKYRSDMTTKHRLTFVYKLHRRTLK